jgi:hypothetical protein
LSKAIEISEVVFLHSLERGRGGTDQRESPARLEREIWRALQRREESEGGRAMAKTEEEAFEKG